MKHKIGISIVALYFFASTLIIPARAQDSAYLLHPEDVLHITVYEQPDLDTTVRISSTGEITFPLLGKIRAAGLTVTRLKYRIERLLAEDYLVDPYVQVFIEKYHVKQVSVLGAVQKPGKYDMYTERETTVLEAIAMAGGFSDVAKVNGTRIIRKENDEEHIIPIKVTDITKKGLKEKDIPVQSGDIIFVPESFF